MAWQATIDEQDTLVNGGVTDAPSLLSTLFRLAEGNNQQALGLLDPSDADVYSLGTLFLGSYAFSGAGASWLAGSEYLSDSAPYLRLYDSSGAPATGWSQGSVSFSVETPAAYFLVVATGSTTEGSQYAVSYERTAPVNLAAVANTAISGVPVPGNVVYLAGSLSDGNGTTTSSLAFQWLSGTEVVSTGSSYAVRAEDVGRLLDVVVTFVDDAGYTETFSPAAVLGRTRNAAAPTVSISAEDLSLSDGETTVVEFKLSDASTNFIAADVTVIGGTLTDFSGSGDRYTAVFTLTSQSATAALSVNGGRFSNAEGLFNEDGGDNDNRLSFVPPTAPKLVSDPSLEVPSRPLVRVDTTVGSFDISLRPDKAPASVANLLAYVEDGYYEDTLFHRVVLGFVVQGGGFVAGPQYKTPTYAPIVLESDNGLSNTRGTVAMARTNDPNSATSQFYVNLVDNDFLDRTSTSAGYAVFGDVVSGLGVIDAMAAVPVVNAGGLENLPAQDIVITSATQTAPGLARGPSAVLTLTDLEPGGTWQYSLDAGDTWRAGVGSTLAVPEGRYDLGDILVRQTDAAGNLSPDVNRFGMALEVDDPDTGQVQVLAWGWRSHALVEGVQLSTVVQAPVQTDAQGAATLRGGLDPLLNVTATLSPSAGQAQADAAAVTLQDAVAILKMIAGQPVNPGGAAVSPFQSLAADVDADGHVGLGDALAVLRHAVGQAALAPSWAFVDERDTTLAARPVREPGTPPALQVPVDPAASAPAHLGLVAVLRGDVDGSHAGAPGAAALEAAHPGYLDALIDDLGVSASRFGVYPV